jgi:hypothetical protein
MFIYAILEYILKASAKNAEFLSVVWSPGKEVFVPIDGSIHPGLVRSDASGHSDQAAFLDNVRPK